MEQIFDVFVPEFVEQLVILPNILALDRIQKQIVERIADIPVPKVVEELVEVFKLRIVEIIAETVHGTYLLFQHIICRFGDIETGF